MTIAPSGSAAARASDTAREGRPEIDRVDVVRINARLNVGGIARHVAWLTSGLAEQGYPTLLVAGSVPPGEDDMRGFVEAQGVRPLILPEMSREISPKDLVTVWK